MFLSLEKEIINVEKIDANIKQNPVLAIVEGKMKDEEFLTQITKLGGYIFDKMGDIILDC